MNTKRLVQIFLIFLIVIIIISTFYYIKFKKNLKETQQEKIIVNNNDNETQNIIENISYISTDTRGNKYEISSITGVIDSKNPDIINMKNVSGIIFLKDTKTINIYADTAKYNNKNYDSIFEKNVRVLFENHEILGERLNLDFGANLMTMSKDVIYKNPEAILKADRLVIDLITKSSKIFMDETTKKVIAIYSN